MKNYKKRSLAMVAAGVSALALVGAPLTVLASTNGADTHATTAYTAHLDQLNNSGVTGQSHLSFKAGGQGSDSALHVNLHADGTTPDKIHPVHIHGNEHPEVALCPTTAQDVDNDGFVSVIEGAATYGPIKLNLTSPQTPFGAPPTPALFTPFAGTAELSNFPMANANGVIGLDQTYTFDNSAEAQGALQTLTPLENQHIVVHGGMAPASVDADAFRALGLPVAEPLSTEIYDPLLPIACGEIEANAQNDHNETANNDQQQHDTQVNDQHGAQAAVAAFHARIAELENQYNAARQAATEHFDAHHTEKRGEARDQFIATSQQARDHYVNQFYEARNQFVDQLNQLGETQLRDEVTTAAEHELMSFTQAFEHEKKEFVETASH